MKPEETIEVLNEMLDLLGLSHCSNLSECIAVDKAIQSLEKQKPMKPLVINGECTCPMCDVTIAEKDEYCWKCGQKLEWED